tara:strand:- start:897 stop:1262 length:366 start_codon:yes stop_codon:yes gene_type:complete
MKDFIEVRGKVLQNPTKMPLPARAHIYAKNFDGDVVGTTSNENGDFKISVPRNSDLTFSHQGFKKQTVPSQKVIQDPVLLEEDLTALDEIIITPKKSNWPLVLVGVLTAASALAIYKQSQS